MKRRAMVVALGALAAACGKDGSGTPPSNAGDLTVSYYNAGPTVGAILVSVTGGAVESVQAVPGQQVQVSWAAAALGTTRILVTGRPVTGELFTLRVPDTTLATAYRAKADQVADYTTFALLDPSGNTLTVHR